MQEGYLKPSPPYLTQRGLPGTFLYPADSSPIDITPLELDGKIKPTTEGSEFGAYKIIGRSVSIKRFLYENADAVISTKGNEKIVVYKWTYDKNQPSHELLLAQTAIGVGKTLASAMKSTAAGDMAGTGTAMKAGANAAKLAYDWYNTTEIDLNKAAKNPDSSKFKKVKNAIKQGYEKVTGQRTAVLITVLAQGPKAASKYDTGLSSVSFSNVLAVLKGL